MSSFSLGSWVAEHKLASVGTLWASAVGASLAYTRKGGTTPAMKGSLRLIHARMHAQALTLAVLSSAALMHYLDKDKRVVLMRDEKVVKPAAQCDESCVRPVI